MSFFLIAAAAALAGMLMRLLVEQLCGGDRDTAGVRVGPRQGAAALVDGGNGAVLAGVIAGVPAGVIYNEGMLCDGPLVDGAVGASGVGVASECGSALVWGRGGDCGGGVMSLWGMRAMGKVTVLQLLSGRQSMEVAETRQGKMGVDLRGPAGGGGGGDAGGTRLRAVAPDVGFFAGGAVLSAAMLLALAAIFRGVMRRTGVMTSVAGLAVRNLGASRRRSLLTVGLLAAACFILVAVAANGRDYSRLDTTDRRSGAGGFVLRATTAVPLHFDLGTAAGRARLGISPVEEKVLAGAEVFSLAQSAGDDVSCLNLAKPLRPRLLGVTETLARRGGFPVEVAGGAHSASRGGGRDGGGESVELADARAGCGGGDPGFWRCGLGRVDFAQRTGAEL